MGEILATAECKAVVSYIIHKAVGDDAKLHLIVYQFVTDTSFEALMK